VYLQQRHEISVANTHRLEINSHTGTAAMYNCKYLYEYEYETGKENDIRAVTKTAA